MRCPYTIAACLALFFAVPRGASGQSERYVEDFDVLDEPALPSGWSAPEGAWETSSSVPSPGSGGGNVENKGGSPGSLVSPVFDLSLPSSAVFSYSARRTSTYDSLNVSLDASVDGGTSWTVTLLDSSASLPIPPSIYETVSVAIPPSLLGRDAVRFRLSAHHATGGNLRIDDVALDGDAPISWNRFGFAEGSSSVVDDTDSLVVPIAIRLIPSSDSLQGLQFSLAMTSGLTFVSLAPGISELSSPAWHATYELSDTTLNVILLAEGTRGLAPLSTDSLLVLAVGVKPLGGPTTRTDAIEIRDLVASAASATGDDLFLAVEPSKHEISVIARAPVLGIDSSSVNFGMMAEDSTASAEIKLTNLGTAPLHVLDQFSISGLLRINPLFLSLEPDSSSSVTLTIDASLYGLGPLEDWLVIEHDGQTSPDTVAILGKVIRVDTRGDVNADGLVDVVDLVFGIDLVLGRIELPDTESRLDVHPFPEGNQSVDVRDLTVLAQAIARGVWPDGAVLPDQSSALAKGASLVGDLIAEKTAEGVRLWVRSSEPLRALHVVATVSPGRTPIQPSADLPLVQVGMPYRTSGIGSFSLLAFGLEELPVQAGRPILLGTIPDIETEDLSIVWSMAVDQSMRRRTLFVVEESIELPEGEGGPLFAPPYPNPVDPRSSALIHLPIAVGRSQLLRVSVTDALGRSVRRWTYPAEAGTRVAAWDMRNAAGGVVPSGIYFLTVRSATERVTHRVVIR